MRLPGRRKKPDLVYSATARCSCGAGLAYDRNGESGRPYGGYWDCSAILTGTAVPKGEAGGVEHTDRLPFAFYNVKAEGQWSARGSTTRP